MLRPAPAMLWLLESSLQAERHQFLRVLFLFLYFPVTRFAPPPPGGGYLLEKVTGGSTLLGPIFQTFVCSRPGFSNFSSSLGPIFKFLSILGHNFFICPLLDYQNKVLVRCRVPKLRFCVPSR